MGCGSSIVDVVVVIHSTDPLQEPTTELVKRQSKTLYQSIKWNLFKVPQDLKPFIVYFGCFTLSSVTYMYLFLQDIILIVTGTLILFMYFCPRKTIFLAFQLFFIIQYRTQFLTHWMGILFLDPRTTGSRTSFNFSISKKWMMMLET